MVSSQLARFLFEVSATEDSICRFRARRPTTRSIGSPLTLYPAINRFALEPHQPCVNLAHLPICFEHWASCRAFGVESEPNIYVVGDSKMELHASELQQLGAICKIAIQIRCCCFERTVQATAVGDPWPSESADRLAPQKRPRFPLPPLLYAPQHA